jgi:hypothetical protein
LLLVGDWACFLCALQRVAAVVRGSWMDPQQLKLADGASTASNKFMYMTLENTHLGL